MPKNGKVGIGGVGAKAAAAAAGVNASSSLEGGGDADGGSDGGGGEGGGGENRKDAARVLSTLSGAAFAADGVGREIAGLFTATSDGIFF